MDNKKLRMVATPEVCKLAITLTILVKPFINQPKTKCINFIPHFIMR